MLVKKTILILFMWLPLTIYANEVLEVSVNQEKYNLINSAEFFIDKTNRLTLEDVQNDSSLEFKPVLKETLNFGHETSPIWVRSSLINKTMHDKELYFQIDYARLNHVDFFWKVGNGAWQKHPTVGLNHPYADREIKYRTYVFKFTAPVNEVVELYARVQSTHAVFVPLLITTSSSFNEVSLVDRSIIAAYFGLMIGLIIYNTFIFLSIKDLSYFYYVCFMVCVFYFQFSYHGLHTSFFTNSPWWNDHSIIASIFLTITAGSLFTRHFLHLKEYSILLNRILIFLAFISFILTVFSITIGTYYLATVASFSGLIFCVMAVSVGVILWRSGYKPAKYYLLSWGFLIIGTVVLVLRSLNLIPTIAFSQWAFLAGSAGEAVLLSFAMAYRINVLEHEKDESEKAVIRAQAENNAKSEFLSKMSHEIRTPLNGMLGMIYMLKDSRLDKDQVHYLDIAHSSGRALLNVIDDVLDYSKIAAGKMELEQVSFCLEKLVNESVSLFSMYAHEKNIDLYMSVEAGVPQFVEGDPTRLRQVIVNLVSNALKFTDHGEIHVRLSCPNPQDLYRVRFSVNDTGIGISTEGIQKLFKSFSQADNSTTRRYGGTGLGLAICQEFIRLMGGEIDVVSQPDQGTTFVFDLLFSTGHPDDSLPRLEKDDLRVFLVSGNVGYCQAMSEQAKTWGVKIDYAIDIEDAHLAIQANPSTSYDVVIFDMSLLPDENLLPIKQLYDHFGSSKSKLLLLTAYLQPLDKDDITDLMIDQIIVKPTGPYELKEAIINLLSDIDSSQKKIRSVTKLPQFPGLKVLVAEDNTVNQMVIKAILQKFSIDADLVENGQQAVDLFLRQLKSPYQMVLMDIEMPEMDGFMATKRIREIERIYHLPETVIFALSAHALKEHEKESLQSGMNGHLKKPINVDKLEKALIQWFK